MSGGSYNYLCFEDEEQLFEQGTLNDLKNIENRLNELGYTKIAEKVSDMSQIIKESLEQVTTMKEELNDILKAVEWHDSLDYGIEEVEEAINRYENPKKK
ncbi:TPA: hypothetical protein ROY01_005706 [Bacillus toyonensis]|nr:hypothetical protein [Bacillus toyonensis]